jgi:hypothetical protein
MIKQSKKNQYNKRGNNYITQLFKSIGKQSNDRWPKPVRMTL